MPIAARPRRTWEVGAVPSSDVNVQELVVRVGTIGCFAGGAAVGALAPVPQKFEAAAGADWVVRAVQAFATFLALLCVLTAFENGVIKARLPRAFSTRSLAWPDPVTAGRTIEVVDIGQPESDLRLKVRKLDAAVTELADSVERIQRRLDAVERRRWWHR